MEALRYLNYLKPDGKVVVNDFEIGSMPILSGKADYPSNAVEILQSKAKTIVIDAAGEAEKLGNPKVMNIILLGTIIKAMGLEEIDWEKIVKENIKESLVEINLKALDKGINLV
jgi:indolepyruvate ferredoxin oxidoreductase beta subunit